MHYGLLLLIGGITFIVYRIIKYYQFTAKYPTGPAPYPFIGNFLDMDFKQQHNTYKKFKPDFDGVYTLFTFSIPIVVLDSYETVKEAFVDKGEDFAGRPTTKIDEVFSYMKNSGIINSYGVVWREQRRTALTILRDFGMGKNVMEEKVKHSIKEFLEYVDSIEDKNRVNLRWPIQLMVSNIINEILFGYRYKYDACQKLMDYVNSFVKMLADITDSKLFFLWMAIPAIEHIPYIGRHATGKHKANVQKMAQHIIKEVDEALKTYQDDLEPECFVHAYNQKMQKGLSPYLNMDQMVATCADFFSAGQETTTTTLRWSVLWLASDQTVQDRLRQEIFDVVGKDRLPSMQDKVKMPFASACVLELQRKANILSTNVFHQTTKDTSVKGQFIPEGTFIAADLHGLLAHGPLFEDPDGFNPARYLHEDGKTFKKDLVEQTIPFSIGKRACAGEALARMELFLGVTSLLQNYRILPSDDGPLDFTPTMGAVVLPTEQNLKLEKI